MVIINSVIFRDPLEYYIKSHKKKEMMKKYKFLMIIAFLGMLLLSCKRSEKNNINTSTATLENKKKESEMLVANLPTLVDSKNYIVFSLRNNQLQEVKRSSYTSDNWYTNYLDNLIFQNIKTQETHVLSKKKIKIISYERLIDSLNPSLNTTLYQIIDSFPKNEKEDTFTALYLSTNEGKNFTKITTKNEHLHSWKYIPETQNIYFITNNDSDNNRKLNVNDGQTMHSVSVKDFKRKDELVEELKSIQ